MAGGCGGHRMATGTDVDVGFDGITSAVTAAIRAGATAKQLNAVTYAAVRAAGEVDASLRRAHRGLVSHQEVELVADALAVQRASAAWLGPQPQVGNAGARRCGDPSGGPWPAGQAQTSSQYHLSRHLSREGRTTSGRGRQHR